MHLVRSTNGVIFIDEQRLVRPSALAFVSPHGFLTCRAVSTEPMLWLQLLPELFEHNSGVLRVEWTRCKAQGKGGSF